MKQCEGMAKLGCRASELKSDKQQLRNELWTTRTCECCDLFELEDARHLIISCPSVSTLRNEMLQAINESNHGMGKNVLSSSSNLLALFLGKPNTEYQEKLNWEIFCIIAKYVYYMYIQLIKQREGIC